MIRNFLIAIIFSSSLISAFAKIEQAGNTHSLARGPLILSDKITNYSSIGYGFINSRAETLSTLRLTRNDNGDLLWNSNVLIDSNGAPLDRNFNKPGGLGGRVLYQSADNETSTVNPAVDPGQPRILSVDPVNGNLSWVRFGFADTFTGGADNTCSKACKSLAKNNSNIVESTCTSSREGIFAVDCASNAGIASGLNHVCSCLTFNI